MTHTRALWLKLLALFALCVVGWYAVGEERVAGVAEILRKVRR